MKKSKLKIMLILSVFLALAMILCIFIFKNPKDKQEYNIDKKEAKILEIENKKIYDNMIMKINKRKEYAEIT